MRQTDAPGEGVGVSIDGQPKGIAGFAPSGPPAYVCPDLRSLPRPRFDGIPSRFHFDVAFIFRLCELRYRCTKFHEKWKWDKEIESLFIDELEKIVGKRLLPMIFNAFMIRSHRVAAFPSRISLHYWNSASAGAAKDHHEKVPVRLAPPWYPHPEGRCEELIPTATLSLDLRKSTYCMEFATSAKEFGDWLDHLVEKMRAVAHLHGGVFDKFTGDAP